MITKFERIKTGFIDCLMQQKDCWRNFYKQLRKSERQAIRRYLDYLKFPGQSWEFNSLTIETVYSVNHCAREAYKAMKKEASAKRATAYKQLSLFEW